MLKELEQKIRKAIPELNELGVGCVVKSKNGICRYTYLYHINKEVVRCQYEDRYNYNIRISDLEIIGKPIQLNHVLEYVYMQTDYVLFRDKLFFSINDFQDFKNYIIINPKSNLLSAQSEQLIKFINELKND